jgi:hypothetical protein
MFGVCVKFKTHHGWSREYTYLHDTFVEPDTLVLVADRGWFEVVAVKRCIEDFQQNPEITYKNIVCVTNAKRPKDA